MSEKPSSWGTPPTIIAVVTALVSVGSFWASFNGRITANEERISYVAQSFLEHKTDEGQRLIRVEAKLDRLIERGSEK